MNGAQESMAHIATFDPRLLRRRDTSEGTLTFVEGLGQALLNCAERHVLPSEAGLEWARAGREVGLRGYRRFPSL